MSGDLAAKFAEHEITPNIIPNPPAQVLNCNWDGIQVQPGQTMSPRNLRFAPRVTLAVDPESTFTLVMIDPDNLSRKNPSVAEWLHWLVTNIPASNINEGINGGQHQCPYGSPAPQPRTDVHRYIILLFEHQGRRVQVPQVKSRAKFSVKQFMQKNNLGKLFTYFSDPIAGNFFLAQHEG
uniref:Phosphatidylethanolamine-binding protein n=1 Tax=Ascaris lumbricoides TaxID=6252 RepID=A0A0M3I893_ASCLU